MALGRKTGGRVAGTPNRRTLEFAARLEQLGVDPVAGLAALAIDPQVPVEVRARVLSELCSYLYPKRKALDLGAHEGRKVEIRIGIPPRNPTPPPADTGIQGTAE